MVHAPATNERVEGSINVWDLGYTPLASTSINTGVIQSALASGANVYFPGVPDHTYLVDAELLVSSHNQKIFGDGNLSQIEKAAGDGNGMLFRVSGTTGTTITGLSLKGFGTGLSPSDSAELGGIIAINCTDFDCDGNRFSQFSGICVYVQNVQGYSVTSNRMTDNEPVDFTGTQLSGDIMVRDNSGQVSTNGIISHNRCFSNNRNGINIGQGPVRSCVIEGNNVAALDASFVPVAAGSLLRKEGIVLQYDTNNQQSPDDWTVTCTGNTVENCGWSGIYINGLDPGASRSGGHVTVVANEIHNVAQRVEAGSGFQKRHISHANTRKQPPCQLAAIMRSTQISTKL